MTQNPLNLDDLRTFVAKYYIRFLLCAGHYHGALGCLGLDLHLRLHVVSCPKVVRSILKMYYEIQAEDETARKSQPPAQ